MFSEMRRGGMRWVSGALLGVLGLAATAARAEPAAIRVGMSAPLSGPAEPLGKSARAGIEAYFALVNERGGVHGRPIALVARDDADAPGQVAPNLRSLIADEHVLALIGSPSGRGAAGAATLANEARVPLFALSSGPRPPSPGRYVIYVGPSHAQEATEIVRGLVDELGIAPDQIAFFTQRDGSGDAGHRGAVAALRARGYQAAERLPHGRYRRDSVDVEAGLSRLLDPVAHPRAVVMVGAPKPSARLIKLAKQHGLEALFVSASSAPGDALRRELGRHADDVVVTQGVPSLDSDLPIVREYRARVKGEALGSASLEAFIAARALVAALEQAGPGASAEAMLDALEGGAPLDLGLEAPVQLSRERRQLSDRVWPTVLHRGRFAGLTSWRELKSAVPSR